MYIKIIAQKFYEYSLCHRGYSKKTILRYKTSINYYCKYANVEKIEEVTEENVKALFFHGRKDKLWQTSSYLTVRNSLIVFFRWCIEQRFMLVNPVDNIEIPKLEKRFPTKLKKTEAFRLLELINNYPYMSRFLRFRNHAIFAIYLFAGLRRSELLKLRVIDVDIENHSIFVNQGKGSKDRIIPMSFTLAQILQRYIDERKRLNKTCPELFTALNTNSGLTEHGLKRLVVQIQKIPGTSFTIHKLRHTFATLMLEGGCDIFSLSKMMGHSDIKTTTIYLAASVEHLQAQMAKHPLNELIG